MSQDSIKAKYIIRAEIRTTSPFLISSGESEDADKDVILLPNGKPYVPASSFAGVLHQIFKYSYKADKKIADYLWGSTGGDNRYQSHLQIDNLLPKGDATINIRDGVKINNKTGTAEKGSKYNYQLVEPEVIFDLNIEATLRNSINQNQFEAAFTKVCQLINTSEELRIGAHTNFGFGRIRCDKLEAYRFEFPNKATEWFEYIENGQLSTNCKFQISVNDNVLVLGNQFKITAQFELRSSLLTATYAVDPSIPDKAQLKSNEKFVVSGKSLKGAIRQRALKILSTQMPLSDAEEKLKNLMGWVNPNNPEEDAIKSRLRIEETIIEDSVVAQEQPRIKINRFEGGTMPPALFSSEAVWQKEKTSNDDTFSIEFTLNKMTIEDANLLLHILKDLWTGDLAIGGEKNIGRGTLVGKRAKIKWAEKTVEFKASSDELGRLEFISGTANDLVFT